MLIVVTGSSGKIGSQSVRELLAAGHDVVPVDVRPGTDHGLPRTRVVDLKNYEDVLRVVKGVDAVCHLGNLPSFRHTPSADGFSNNVTSTYNVFHAAFEAGVRRVVNASSIQSYGAFSDVRSTPLYLPLDEDHPLIPRDAYPLSKAMGESIADTFVRREPAASVFSLRFTAVRGPDGPPPSPTAGGQGSLWTYVRVEDAARCVRICCEAATPGHTPLNVVARRSTRRWTHELISEAYGTVPPFRRELSPDDALISGDLATRLLGFVAELPPPS